MLQAVIQYRPILLRLGKESEVLAEIAKARGKTVAQVGWFYSRSYHILLAASVLNSDRGTVVLMISLFD